MAYVWLLTKSRKQIMKSAGLYNGSVDDKRDDAYWEGVEATNIKYLPKKYHKKTYYKETDIVLRNLRRFQEDEIRSFKLEEFKCGCGRRYCSGYPVVLNSQLLINLQMLRDDINQPMTITSGLRCQEYNDSLRGSIPTSKHTQGKAVDFVAKKTETVTGRAEVKKKWQRLPKYGYTYSDTDNMGTAVHCDVK